MFARLALLRLSPVLQSNPMPADQSASITQTCPKCGAKIDTTAAEPLARIACPQCGEKVKVERAFNNFVIVETLGVGGMGTVYKARDIQLDRFVALKLLRADVGGEVDHAARLQREARVAASVSHPNVVQVFSSGTDHGQFYLVMELVDHGSLDDWIEERKRLPEALVLHVGIQMAKGLRAAHAKGLIHRDVKPANILFADEQTAKIGDFGLAGVAAEKAENEIWGTPYYVAPERLKNQPEDFRSDIYSLGATLFHALAGTAPIQGETNSATALYKMKSQPADLRKIAPDVSHGTADVLARMIALDREKRFASYDELVAALEQAQRRFAGDNGSGAGRSKAWVWLGATVVALAAAASFFVYQSQRHAGSGANNKSVASPTGLPPAEIERQYNDARKQLLSGKHNIAHAAFARLALDARNHQPLYDWIRLHEGLSALVGRDQAQARQAFQEVENAGEHGFAKDDADLARFFNSTAKLLGRPGSVPADQAVFRADNYEAFALFLLALKDIGFLDINDAIGLLERFSSAQPSEKYSWIADYKPLAQKYLDDCRAYLAWKNSTPNDPKATTDTRGKLKTTSAISDDVRAAEKRLEKTAQPPPRPASSPAASSAAPLDKAKLVAEWKRKLIDDLNRARFNGRIVDLGGAEYSGVLGASDQRLRMKLPYGEVQLPWTNLSPQTLLAITKSFITAGAPDFADRQWLAAAYANATGQGDEAGHLAESAAAAKPQYREQITQLLGASPPSR